MNTTSQGSISALLVEQPIVKLIAENPGIQRKTVCNKLGCSPRIASRKLQFLKRNGLIARIDGKNQWELRKEDYIRRIDGSTDGFRYYEGILVDQEDGSEVRLWCYPSVTTKIDAVYPKDAYLIKWIREQGIGGQAIFEKAGDEGTESHIAIDEMLKGNIIPTFDMEDSVKKNIQSFLDWVEDMKPKFLTSEEMVVSHKYRFAGTMDSRVVINGQKYVIDYKTSNSVHDKHKIQNAAYWATLEDKDLYKTAILHLGNSTKKGYSFLEYDPFEYWEQYKHFNATFEMLHPNSEPKVIEYPLEFLLPKELQLS